MKKTVLLFIAMIISTGIVAQAPSTFSFQAVIRDTNNQIVANSPIGMKTAIIQGSTDGTIVYQEIYHPNPMTNINGLVTLEVGNGLVLSGDFATINWSDGPYFIKTEADPTGGTTYTITGIVQLMSVPYALHAQTADNLSYEIEETDPVFTASPAAGITGTSLINWDTAFSWGDHSLADYLTAETDPTWSGASDQTGAIGRTGNVGIGTTTPESKQHILGAGNSGTPLITVENSIDAATSLLFKTMHYNWLIGQNMWNKGLPFDGFYIYDQNADAARLVIRPNGNIGIGVNNPLSQLHTNGSIRFAGAGSPGNGKVLTSDENGNATWQNESDPVFTASPASGISSDAIENWDTAHSWGNHADAGYISEEAQTLADVAALDNSVNTQIKDLTDPTDAQDAATKAYVDILASYVNSLLERIDDLENTLFSTVTDLDGKVYQTVIIGNQRWF